MKGQKKYCLNVSSYKYKRECMKLISSTLSKGIIQYNDEIIPESENLCPGGKHCKNFRIILYLEQKIKTLNDTVNQLIKINEYSDSNHNRNITPNKIIEPKRQDSFNEFCNSFRNSVRKKKIEGKNLIGNITLPILPSQINEPYRIKPYTSIYNENKFGYKKIPNRRNVNMDFNSSKNLRNKFCLETKDININKQYFSDQNIIIKNNKDKDHKKEDENEMDKNTYISDISNKKEDLISINNKNIKINDNKCEYEEKNYLKKSNKNIEESINKNENDENINKKEPKKNINNNLPHILKVKNYKIIPHLKLNKTKNQRYENDLSERTSFEKKIHKEDNKIFFLKNKVKERERERNIFNAPKNKFLSNSFAYNKLNKSEGNHSLFNTSSTNSKILQNQSRIHKFKINSLNNFKPLSLIQKPFKINVNHNELNLNNLSSSIPKSENNKVNIYDKDYSKNYYSVSISPSNSFEFKQFIKELEYKKENKEKNNDKYQIFNEIYNLSCYKNNILIEKLKQIPIEKIDKYSSFIKYSLKYLKDSIDLLNKFKVFHNFIYIQKNKNINNNNDIKEIINNEFKKYKENTIKLLNCEDVHIYIYDFKSECLKLKGEKEESELPKDKELIRLCFSSGKKVRYESDTNSSQINSERKILNKVNNLLIYPLIDKDDFIYGVIEAVNKNQDINQNLLKINYCIDKPLFNKNDEIIISLISKYLGNFCKCYNYINNKNIYMYYYRSLLLFFQKLFIKNNSKDENDITYMIDEVNKILKNIFEINDIKFLLCKKDNFYDIQKNKDIPYEGIVYKAYKDKIIIYTNNPLVDNNYSIKSDININIFGMNKKEQLITFPIFDLNKKKVIMIIQFKTNKNIEYYYKYNNTLSIENEKLNDENYFIIENISCIIQKYLYDNIELIYKY